MALPAKAAAVVAKGLRDAFRRSPSAVKLPDSSFEASVPSLWRGLRDSSQFQVRPNGDLVLNPGKNFSGKTTGISFTDNQDVAWKYASRQPETPVPSPDGIVVRIRRDLFEDVDDFLVKGPVKSKPRLKYEGIEGEQAFYTEKPFVVPRGSWEAKKPKADYVSQAKKRAEKKVEAFYEMDDRKFMRRYGNNRAALELEEYSGGVDPFGFDVAQSRHLSAQHSGDAVDQFLFHITQGTENYFMELALRAKVAAKPKGERDAYIRLLNSYADESSVTGLYGRDWFLHEWIS